MARRIVDEKAIAVRAHVTYWCHRTAVWLTIEVESAPWVCACALFNPSRRTRCDDERFSSGWLSFLRRDRQGSCRVQARAAALSVHSIRPAHRVQSSRPALLLSDRHAKLTDRGIQISRGGSRRTARTLVGLEMRVWPPVSCQERRRTSSVPVMLVQKDDTSNIQNETSAN